MNKMVMPTAIDGYANCHKPKLKTVLESHSIPISVWTTHDVPTQESGDWVPSAQSLTTTRDKLKYLEVTITNEPRWSLHIFNITNMAHRTLGFTRSMKITNKQIKQAAYKKILSAHYGNASPAWDPHTSFRINTVDITQQQLQVTTNF